MSTCMLMTTFMPTLCGHSVSFSVNWRLGRPNARCESRSGSDAASRLQRMVTKIESRALDRRVDHRETFDAFLVQGGIKLRLCRDMAAAERAMQPPIQAHQYRALSAKVFERDLFVACDRVQHDVRCTIARLKWSLDVTFRHDGTPSHDLVKKRQYDQPCGIKPVPRADVLCQREISLGLGHVAPIKVQRRKTIIAWKQLLRLAGFARHLDCLIVATSSQIGPEMALMDLPEHDQRHGEMLALIKRAVDFDRLFGGRHPLLSTFVGEGATGNGKIGEKARLEPEIADPTRDIESAPANLHGFRRVDNRVEHTEIGVTAAGHVEETGGLGCCDTLLHLADRLLVSAKPRQCHALGVERLCNGARRLESDLPVGVRRNASGVAKRLVRPSRGGHVIARAKRKTAALLQEVRPLDGRVGPSQPFGRLG